MTLAGALLRVVVLALLFAIGTWLFGWWCVPVIAALYALLDRRSRARGTIATIAALLGWAGILVAYVVRGGAVSETASRMATLMKVPSAAFVALTFAFAALLASSAATIVTSVVKRPPDRAI